jgi:succinoglycan biosynthesis transport protein ExoP
VDGGYGSVTAEFLKEPDIPGKARGKDFLRLPLTYLLIGLGAGFALTFVRMSLPNAGLSVERLGRGLGMPCLGEVSADASSRADFAEAMDRLREKILLSSAGAPVRRVAFASGGDPEGATAGAAEITVGVAIALATPGVHVLLIDADMRRPRIHRHLHLDGRSGLSTVLSGRARLAEVAIPLPGAPGVDVLQAGPLPPKPADLLGSDALRLLLEEAQQRYNYIVMDAGMAWAESGVEKVLGAADLAVLVLRRSDRGDLRRWHDALCNSGGTLAGFVRTS